MAVPQHTPTRSYSSSHSDTMAVTVRASAAKAAVRPSAPKAVKATVQRLAQGACIAGTTLALAFSAHADATVKLGADSGNCC
jgi:hypothetical protein